jgi:hypothetical protein
MGLAWADFLVALRREAGVMFTDALSSSSDSDTLAFVSRSGVLGRWTDRTPFLPLSFASVCRVSDCVREGFLTGFSAPGRDTLRLKVTVVWRVTLTVVGRVDFELVVRACRPAFAGADLLRARFSREAACRECSFASCSARSRAVCDAINLFLALTEPIFPAKIFRFFGEF